jgi:flagellar biogenesis protein FliO
MAQDRSWRGMLVALYAIVAILLVAIFLVRELSASARLQDCLLSGRTNCVPIPVR